jgi:hypothetical protein
MKNHFIILFFILIAFSTFAQKPDSLTRDSVQRAKALHKQLYSGPRKASLMSAILPGLGQAYNKKFWKIPIIYAGLGGFGYFFVSNNAQYNEYRRNLIAEADEDPETINEMPWLDYCGVGFVIMYIINIVDANVDAHLKTFDISDDLSLRIEPWQTTFKTGYGFKTTTGISLKLNF